jgi:hypothetical protein
MQDACTLNRITSIFKYKNKIWQRTIFHNSIMEEQNEKDITKETLKPITKVKSKLDKELQEQEVESTGCGMGAGGG